MKNLLLTLLYGCFAAVAIAQSPVSTLLSAEQFYCGALFIGGGSFLNRGYFELDPDNNVVCAADYLNYTDKFAAYRNDTLWSDVNTTSDLVLIKMVPDGSLSWYKR